MPKPSSRCSPMAMSDDVLDGYVEAFGAVYIEDRGEWWLAICCRQCDASGEWYHAADLTEYHGEWLCADYLPDPVDDDDPALANACVLARDWFLYEMSAIAIEVAKWQAAGERARNERLRREQEAAELLRLETMQSLPLEPCACGCTHRNSLETPGLADRLAPRRRSVRGCDFHPLPDRSLIHDP